MNKHLLGLLVAALLLSACEQTSTTPSPVPIATNVPPTATSVPEPSPTPGELPVEVIKDVPYVVDGDPLQKLDIYRPKGLTGPFPILFAIHGGGSNKTEMSPIGYYFAKRGYAVVSINHRQTPRYNYPVPVQ
ncbi:MAG: alpha/beta hydrolase, partial [Chloroflexi bacterium]|nr:alpha/beta hydrolase [Chloroflexota bacterium]